MEFNELSIRVLLEALVEGEKIKPSQVAKREVFRRYGILGTDLDRVLTAVIYKLNRKLGLVDKVLRSAGVDVESLDPFSRWLLRVYAYSVHFSEVEERRFKRALRLYGPIVVSEYSGKEGAWRIRALMRKVETLKYRPTSVEEVLELRYSVSSWLIKRLISILGYEETEEFLKAVNKVPSLGFRVNSLRNVSVADVVKRLRDMGVEAWVSPYVPCVVKYRGTVNYERFEPLKQGDVIPQDDSSALAALILDPKPGEVVVDMCAAPGGKTEHIGELMKNRGTIIAIELYSDRAAYLRDLVKRAGIEIVEVVQGDSTRASTMLGEEIADKVLLDPPCSSTGAIAKHGEARWRLSEERLAKLVELQKALLREGIRLLKPGGRLLYCVCSVLPEEGEEVIEWALREFRDQIRLIKITGPFDPGLLPGTMRAWPHKHDTTGFFYALLEKLYA